MLFRSVAFAGRPPLSTVPELFADPVLDSEASGAAITGSTDALDERMLLPDRIGPHFAGQTGVHSISLLIRS